MAQFPQTGVELVAKNAGKYITDINSASKATSRFTASLQSAGSIALKAGAVGLTALGAGFIGAAGAGLKFNSTMENVEAQLFAFLKDGEKVADTLSLIETRAAQTPFAFEDMARATASLIPAAKQSGKEIEELISVAEVLAASNPAEGLEGAAFSLREALSGDFVSIVERFNLPRQRLKELKADGVPALEAVSTAMRELGLDSELVTNLSQTATGRLSTVKDNLLGIAAAFTQPFFEVFSSSLGDLIPKLESIRPVAEGVADAFSRAFNELQSGVIPLENIVNGFLMSLGVGRELREEIKQFVIDAQEFVNNGLLFIQENIAPLVGSMITWQDVLIGVGIAIATVVVPALFSMALSVAAILFPLTAVIAAVALVRTAWTENWFGIQEFTAIALETIQNYIQVALSAIQGWWSENGEYLKSQTLELWTAITGFWETYGQDLINIATFLIEYLNTQFKVGYDFIIAATKAFFALFRGDFEAIGKFWKDWVVKTIDFVVAKFKDFDWAELGASVGRTIVQGFTSAIQGLISAAAAAVSGVSQTISGFFGGGGGGGGSSSAGYSPDATPSQMNNYTSSSSTTNVNFTGNYASTPAVTDQSSLVAIVGGY